MSASPPADLLSIAKTPGEITEAGLRNDISVGLQYLAAWLSGNGAVGIFNLMEDAATAEISRSQVWQWLHNDIDLADGPRVTRELVERIIGEELAKIREASGADFDEARLEAGHRPVQGGGAGRRLRGVPHRPGIRADALGGTRELSRRAAAWCHVLPLGVTTRVLRALLVQSMSLRSGLDQDPALPGGCLLTADLRRLSSG